MTSVNSVTANPAQVTTTAGGTQQAASTATATAGQASTARPVDLRKDALKASDPPPADRAELPNLPKPAGLPVDGPGFGQPTLDRAFSAMEALEKEMSGIDPTSPQGSKRMMEIERMLQRVDQLISMITNMRKMVHEMSMQAIRSIG